LCRGFSALRFVIFIEPFEVFLSSCVAKFRSLVEETM